MIGASNSWPQRVAATVAMCAFAALTGFLAWYLAGFWLLLFAATLFGVSLGTASDWLAERTGMPP